MTLFSKHLRLLGIDHRRQDIPVINFDAMNEESPLNVMQRATMGFDGGLLTLNQCLELLNLPTVSKKDGGDDRKAAPEPFMPGELPREHEQKPDDKPDSKGDDDEQD